ncbi:MAG TPA: hypothetical protein VM658_14310 [bacterium]|nr:hypothetical protein [bacterium]
MKAYGLSKFRVKSGAALLGAPILLMAVAAYIYFAAAGAAGGAEAGKARAWIDKDCVAHPATITVPAGKTASGFKSGGLVAGIACHGAGAPENKGFAIRDGRNNPVYLWSQYQDQTPYEKGGPLDKLTLPSGEYKLTVAGGAGAEITLEYQLK